MRILLADDEVLSNTALRAMIEEGGKYQVSYFFNGLDLCNSYEEQDDVGAVMLDFEMPHRNGIETAKWIRNYELSENKKRVPIIGITGHESNDVRTACINAGMDKVLSKPIYKKEILKVLNELM